MNFSHSLCTSPSLSFLQTTPTRMSQKEFRLHSIIFGLRSVFCTVLSFLSICKKNEEPWRSFAVIMSCITVVGASVAADIATGVLCPSTAESTTATMPLARMYKADSTSFQMLLLLLSVYGNIGLSHV